jgi:uncharacterized membrane protein YidH (DUF202 family)
MSAIPDRQSLQPERTALAWQRTAITASVVTIPLIVVDARLGAWVLALLESAAALAGIVLVAAGFRRRFSALGRDDVMVSPYPQMLRVGAVATLTAVGGVATAALVALR